MPPPEPGQSLVDDHVYQYEKDELFGLVEEAGFAVERFAYAPGVLHRHFNLTLRPV
jgi:hypothetical protein